MQREENAAGESVVERKTKVKRRKAVRYRVVGQGGESVCVCICIVRDKMDDKGRAMIPPTSLDGGANTEELVRELKTRIYELESRVTMGEQTYYASDLARCPVVSRDEPVFPQRGMPSRFARQIIEDYHAMDCNERLNTSSYVNVVFEPDEEAVAALGMRINIADQTVYPVTFEVHDHVVNMIAHLWNAPRDSKVFVETGVHAGAGTVGSTEACLLAGLALKFRWRAWYRAKHGLSEAEVRREYPNIVISSMYQAAWEKLFRYMDIEPRLIHPTHKTMTISGDQVESMVDDHTIGVVCIMGNHYSGHYDPVWEVNDVLERINKEKGWQIGIHVDAASGGFIAPFQKGLQPWDFRLKNVLSISASGHKFGESVCGTGWVVWRAKEDLSEHIAISISYLGGNADSYTLNFSRPASGIMVQFYKILRMGHQGYANKAANQMETARVLRERLRSMTYRGKPRFVLLDYGDHFCLPVVAAMLNPELSLPYDDIDLQHTISDDYWYVSGYRMQYHNPMTEEAVPLFTDIAGEQSMFRVVVKSNMTMEMALCLGNVIERACGWLDGHLVDEQLSMFERDLKELRFELEEENLPEKAEEVRLLEKQSTALSSQMSTATRAPGIRRRDTLGVQGLHRSATSATRGSFKRTGTARVAHAPC